MNRREFLGSLSAAAITTRFAQAQDKEPTTALFLGDGAPATAIPREFIGLSYESAQLANPAFFSPSNQQLIALFRELSPTGNLRLGGGSSNFTTYSDTFPSTPLPFEVFGPDTSKTVKTGTVTSARALHHLRGFLDATGWSCLYGLNLGRGTAENAAREAAAAQHILGPRLLAFQIGNEPDSFRNRYRPAEYSPADFIAEWNKFHRAIVNLTPNARFAGPDISNKLAYLSAFAAEAPKHSDIILLTSHYYAMGPAGTPTSTIENLLSADPKHATLKVRDLGIVQQAQKIAHLPYRVSECNSCWNGGQPGVSDVFASALWAADYSLECASRGWAGVNFHGGGNGVYSPIVGAPSTGFSRRPEFYGIQFASQLNGARMLPASLVQASAEVSSYVFEKQSGRHLVLINKTSEPVSCSMPRSSTGKALVTAPMLSLTAPAIDATDGIQLALHQGSSHRSVAVAPPYSATIFSLSNLAR